ncbi:cysteine hydrolase family protein [Nonomuraea basaltis]|uniref:cysteine hydrolase family protein n=1 Tax=Nonomuraea basaltis TaxID=2495887 RepID=UPI00110C6DCF|nr:isochorismatase family cysteine hydrolase [Nonomuraea basaltis]TMR88477.1 cysteine hydrolase [Nonomuraea basaltis]
MADTQYEPAHTGLLLVDPYNDFLSEGGKAWPMVEEVATEVGLLDNLRAVTAAARAAGIQVFVVPHRRWREGNHANWNYLNAYQAGGIQNQMFAEGTWGGDWHPDFVPQANDVVVHEHWGQSGFANTDLDLQLKQHGITHVVTVGMLANTCIESTSRFAMELGYHVTLVRGATAAWTREMLHAAHDLNGPTYAHAIVTADEIGTAFKGAQV